MGTVQSMGPITIAIGVAFSAIAARRTKTIRVVASFASQAEIVGSIIFHQSGGDVGTARIRIEELTELIA